MPGLMGIDIETYSSAPLPRCGVYRYCDAPDFEILLFSYAFDDEPVQTIDLARGETLPKEVISALEDPDIIKVAYNAQFERVYAVRPHHRCQGRFHLRLGSYRRKRLACRRGKWSRGLGFRKVCGTRVMHSSIILYRKRHDWGRSNPASFLV